MKHFRECFWVVISLQGISKRQEMAELASAHSTQRDKRRDEQICRVGCCTSLECNRKNNAEAAIESVVASSALMTRTGLQLRSVWCTYSRSRDYCDGNSLALVRVASNLKNGVSTDHY